MGWKWNEEFIKWFAVHMRENGISPWYTGTQCAKIFKFLEDYGKEEQNDNVE